MYEKQMTRNYKLQDKIESKCTDEVKDLIRVTLEPDAKKRPDIFKVCAHPWFPIILREAELLGMIPVVNSISAGSSSTSTSMGSHH